MSTSPTPIENQVSLVTGQSSDLVSQSYDPSSIAYRPSSSLGSFLNFLDLKEKSAPTELAEEVNAPGAKAGATIMILDRTKSNEVVYATNKFYLQNFSIQNQEKVQLLETFDSSIVSFFGETVKVYSFRAAVVDHPSSTNPHKSMHQSSLLQLYKEHLRGTKLVKEKRIAVMKIMNHLVYGYPMNMNVAYSSSQDKIATMSFNWVVTKHSLSLSNVANERDLEKLYTQDLEQKSEFVEAIEKVLSPVNKLLKISSKNFPIIESLRGRLIWAVGVNYTEGILTIQPLKLQQPIFSFLSADYWDIVVELTEAIVDQINEVKSTSAGLVSPKISLWTEQKLNWLMDSASRASNNWESYEYFKQHLEDIYSLQQSLTNFKVQLGG